MDMRRASHRMNMGPNCIRLVFMLALIFTLMFILTNNSHYLDILEPILGSDLPSATTTNIEEGIDDGTDGSNTNHRLYKYDYTYPTHVYEYLTDLVLPATTIARTDLDVKFASVSPAVNHSFPSISTITTKQHPQRSLVIDVMSTGSEIRPEYLHAQVKTWASHISIRNFWAFTERNDVEPNCTSRKMAQSRDFVNQPLELTTKHFRYCKRQSSKPKTDSNLMKWFRFAYGSGTRKKGVGWMCAQTRFGQSLGRIGAEYRKRIANVLQQQDSEQPQRRPVHTFRDVLENDKISSILPDYLLLVDDDTYINMDQFHTYMLSEATKNGRTTTDVPKGYSGCIGRVDSSFHLSRSLNWTAPVGGFGVFLSKGAIARMIHPIFCTNETTTSLPPPPSSYSFGVHQDDNLEVNEFENNVCARIQDNILYERDRFRPGMTISDLAFEMSRSVDDFCFNSDWIYAYIINYYYLSEEDPDANDRARLHHYQNSEALNEFQQRKVKRGRSGNSYVVGNCNNTVAASCEVTDHICHYMTPERMAYLTNEIKVQHSNQYRDLQLERPLRENR